VLCVCCTASRACTPLNQTVVAYRRTPHAAACDAGVACVAGGRLPAAAASSAETSAATSTKKKAECEEEEEGSHSAEAEADAHVEVPHSDADAVDARPGGAAAAGKCTSSEMALTSPRRCSRGALAAPYRSRRALACGTVNELRGWLRGTRGGAMRTSGSSSSM